MLLWANIVAVSRHIDEHVPLGLSILPRGSSRAISRIFDMFVSHKLSIHASEF